MMDPHQSPRVSIIIPNYNHAAYLKERIFSIVNQTYTDFELIVLDDCSTDNSVEVITSLLDGYPYKLIKNNVNSGSTFAQWDLGIESSHGELIWIAESDDVAEPDFLATLVNEFEAEDVAMAYCQSVGINEQSQKIANLKGWTDQISSHLWSSEFKLNGTYFAISFMAIKNVIPNASAVLFRRAYYTSPYLLKPNFRLGGDLLLWANIMIGRSIVYKPQLLNHYRFHATTVRQSQSSTYLNECTALASWILEHGSAWEHPQELMYVRHHLAPLWFTIGLEPASPLNWWKHRDAYRLLYQLHGLRLLPILVRRMPWSLWRLSLPQRLWWRLGCRSLLRKLSILHSSGTASRT